MTKIESTLWANYERINKKINDTSITLGTEYQMLLEERNRIREQLINLYTYENDTELKKQSDIKEDFKDKVKNIITISTFVISTGISIYAIRKTFKFDETSTVTSTLGRNILNSTVPKM